MRLRLATVLALAGALAVGLGASAQGALPSDFYGVSPATDVNSADADKMGGGGVDVVRLPMVWRGIEKQEDVLTWEDFDAEVRNAANRGMRVQPFVIGTPSWIEPNNSMRPPLDTQHARDEWQQFLRAAVNRYGPGGAFWTEDPNGPLPPGPPNRVLAFKAWQLWNEQNSPTHWGPEPNPGDYDKLVKLSSSAIRSRDGGARIVLGGMFGTPGRPTAIHSDRFLARLYKVPKIERAFDDAALHPYAPSMRGVRFQFEIARRAMKRAGDGGTGIRVTEIGWATDGPAGSPQVVSRSKQAALLRDSFRLMLDRRAAWNVKQIVWYTWRDHDAPCEWCHSAGLFNEQLEPKPSWNAYKGFAR